MKALIKVGYACNEHCTFCHTQPLRELQGAADEVEAKIRRAAALGHRMVVLSGGEPTIRPELVRWARLVASLGLELGLVTNGLVLSYPQVLARLLDARLRYVYMSLHAGVAEVHDRIVRAESFAIACDALDRLQGRGLTLTVNCVVTRQNLAHLRSLVDRATAWPDAVIKFSATEPKGGALRSLAQVVPRIADAAAAVLDALGYARTVLGPDRARHGGFPLCLLPGFEHAVDDLRTHGYWTMVEVGEPDLVPIDANNQLHPSPHCDDCRLRGGCPGLFREYHARHGAAELAPPRAGVRSNACDWVLERREPCAPAGCPLLPLGLDPWEPARHLFVREGAVLARYRCDSRDLADDSLHAIKHGHGQLYLDASSKPAVDDFGEDLVKLARASVCEGCEHRPRCTGLFEPVREDVFARDEAALRHQLAALHGAVLELGCGEGRLSSAFVAAAAAGRLRWTGVDPDHDALARAAAVVPGGATIADTAEHALPQLPTAGFDHVVMAHAWNHLADPVAVLDGVERVLRAGGELWLLDDVPFGLARSQPQHRRGRDGGARWQHHRNDDAARAHARLQRPGLQLLQRREVAPDTSNQWLLRYRRSPA
ncbi:MAG: radical SAM protein [Nannocystaceae bacterium]|nr:radical SAM protein [Nannocystaceae bacterium]